MENVMLGTICMYYKMRWSKASAKSQFMTSIMYDPPTKQNCILFARCEKHKKAIWQ